MIFAPDAVARIRDRRKTQDRRPIKRHREFGFEVPCPYKVGQRYRVQHTAHWTVDRVAEHARLCEDAAPSRARAVVAYLDALVDVRPTGRVVSTSMYVTVTEVRREPLGNIDRKDARREGFTFVPQFEDRWRRLYGNYDPGQEVWVITFTLGDDRAFYDVDRFMKATPGIAGDEAEEHQDYTTQRALAMRNEPPVIDGKMLDQLAAEGLAGHARRNAAVLRRQHVRSLAIRLKDAERRGDPDGILAVCGELQNLERQMRLAA